MSSIATFYKALKDGRTCRVTCPIPNCPDPGCVLSDYPKHAETFHQIDPLTQCSFCLGKVFWKKRCKVRHAAHLNLCLLEFKRDHAYRPPPEPQTPSNSFPRSPEFCRPCAQWISRPRDLRQRARQRRWARKGFYNNVFQEPCLWWTENVPHEHLVPFSEESGLGTYAHQVLWNYQHLGKAYNWWHIMVKAASFDKFVEHMRPLKSEFMVLDYWCLCDGRKKKEQVKRLDDRHHRHMIVVFNAKSHFQKIWRKKVRFSGIRAKLKKDIENVDHLKGVMHYVSNEKAACDGNATRTNAKGKQKSHYHINRPMPPHAFVALGTLTQGGLNKMISFRLQGKKVGGWKKHIQQVHDQNHNLKYCIPIGETFMKYLKFCPLPVREDMHPSRISNGPPPDGYFAWLWDQQTLTFQEGGKTNILDQIYAGNAFLNVVWYNLYILCRDQVTFMKSILEAQEMMDVHMKVTLERERLQMKSEFESDRLKMKSDFECERLNMRADFESERVQMKGELERECVELQMKLDKMQLELDHERMRGDFKTREQEIRLEYQQKLDEREAFWQKELQLRVSELQLKLDESQSRERKLQERLDMQTDEEIQRLRIENGHLQTENVSNLAKINQLGAQVVRLITLLQNGVDSNE